MSNLEWYIQKDNNGKGVTIKATLTSETEIPTFGDMLDSLINVIAPKVRRGITFGEVKGAKREHPFEESIKIIRDTIAWWRIENDRTDERNDA